MSINANYYGTESTWENFPPVSGTTDVFKVPRFNVNQETYGLSGATQLSTCLAIDYPDRYYQKIDETFAHCAADKDAPFLKNMYVTGSNANHTEPVEIEQTSDKNVSIGFAISGNASPYTTSSYIKYFKASATGSNTYGDCAPNYKPTDFTFTPALTESQTDFKQIQLSSGNLSPMMKYPFNRIILSPIIKCSKLKSGKTISDIENATNTTDLSAIIENTTDYDLAAFAKKYGTDNPEMLSDVLIRSIEIVAQYITFDNSDNYNDQTAGMKTSTTGTLSPVLIGMKNVDFDFPYWYKATTDPEFREYHTNIDVTLIKNARRAAGSFKGLTQSTNQYNSATYTSVSAITIAGALSGDTGTGYVRSADYPYFIKPICADTDKFHIKHLQYGSSAYEKGYCVYSTISDYDTLSGFVEYVRKSIAYFGMYFSDSAFPDNTNITMTNSELMLGIIDSNGITHGEYTHGADNATQLQSQWGNDPLSKTPYNPNTPTPTDENDKGDLTTHLNSGYYETSAIYYATTETQIRKFIDFMNTYAPTDADLTADFKGVNPADYITNCLYFPFDVMYSGTHTPIYLSVLNTTATGLKFSSTYGITYVDFGSIYIERYFNDFRDYSPYTKLSVDIPFSNTVNLDISEFYNHYLNIKMCVDFTTGDTITLISRDNLVVKTLSGNCAVQLPISALAMSTYQDTINSLQANAKIIEEQATTNTANTLINTGIGIAAGAVTEGLSTTMLNPATTLISGAAQRDILIEQGKRNEYSLTHTTPSPVQISGGTPNNMMMLEYIPRYTITRCKSLNNINYNVFGKTTGYATVQQGLVSDFAGLIVCADVEFNSISATSTEQDMIKNLLKSGVVV